MNAVFGRGLKTLSLITVVLLIGAFALVSVSYTHLTLPTN